MPEPLLISALGPAMIRFAALFPFVLASLAACTSEPVFRTDTSYIAPGTAQGASCAASCQTSEQVCKARMEDFSRSEYPACMERAKQTYIQCMQGDYKMGCQLSRQNAETVCSYDLSPDYGSCEASYNSCYQSCGGEVIRDRVCVQNCDE